MPAASAPFVHLHVHSAYSLAEGAIKVKDLIKTCVAQDMPAVAITDTGNLFGALEFAMEAAKAGVQPIIGCQVRLGLENHELVLLARSEQGYRNLCRLVSHSFLDTDPQLLPHVTLEKLTAHAEGLIVLTGGIRGPLSQYLLRNQPKTAADFLKALKKAFPRSLYVEIQRHEGWADEERVEEALIDLAYKHDVPLVATNDCYFAAPEFYEAHDALLCIAEGRYVTEDDRRKVTPEHYFKSDAEMRELFADLPEAVANTAVIARRCGFLLKPIDPILPPFKAESGRNEIDEMKFQVEDGIKWRLENFVFTEGMDKAAREAAAKPYLDRLEFELGIIIKMGFSGYFLIVSDFIRWAKDHNIPVGPGRGSGAGSVAAWALRITDLDPLKFNLLFERFLNPERVSLPDFDVDFCQDRRDEVINYVRERYGHDRVAQIITFGQLKARAVVRDVGRVLQMPYGQVDRIAKMIPNNPASPITLEEALAQDADLRAERDKDETTRKLIDIALQLEGLYRHASTHAAGVVISGKPLQELLPLYRDPSSDMAVTQFSMKYIEQAGLLKFDFLGLKTMTVIQKTVELIKESAGVDVDILKVPLDDEKAYRMLSEGQVVGVFQVESAGMRATLMSMKPNRLEDIIALVALYRPGPMENIPRYIEIKEGKTAPDYMHPRLKPYLEETYGILIYQEQVMQAAQALSGYTLGGADLLRRAMGKKIQSEMDAQRDQFIKGAMQHSGISESQAGSIFDQIDKFAGYGFNKSHAAAYAIISYWTAWLKANYPVQFMAASMTLDMGNTDKLAIFRQELTNLGVSLHLPDINKSMPEFSVEDGGVRYALAALKGIGLQAMIALVEERGRKGAFQSVADFANRIDPATMNKRQIEQLAAAGAFDTLNVKRAQVAEAAETILRHAQSLREERESGQSSLFGGPAEGGSLMPDLPAIPEWDPLDKLAHEFEAIGFYLSAHPLDSKAAQLERMGVVPAAGLENMLASQGSALVDMAGVLLKKQIKVSQKSGNKFAFLHMSDTTGVYEVTVFSEALSRARDLLEEGQMLLLKVIAEQRDDQIRKTVQDIKPLEATLARTVKEIHIHLSDSKPVGQLRELLKVEGEGKAEIKVYVKYSDDLDAEIRLPGRWNFSASARNALLRAGGVESILDL